MKIRDLLIGSALAVTLPFAAQAATNGIYVGGAAGVNFATDAKLTGGAVSDTVKFDTGVAGALSLGYGFGNGFRSEIEASLRNNGANGVKSGVPANIGGSTSTWGLLFNTLYDFDTGTAFTPYIGAGIGLAIVDAKLTGNGATVYNDTDTAFAYQAIAGVSYAVNNNLALTADYRYLGTTNNKFNGNNTSWNVGNGNHTILAGLRWTFGSTPAPLPEPVAAPVVTPDYLVFFDFDKSDITREARKIINDAATAAGKTKPITIVVTGHTDTSGSPAYNQKLSERRAAAVKQELVLRGVNPALIQTLGKGENELMVPTAQGVREPSNRRAQIVLKIG
jgi:outer membrane protein OmpA-like peptidoglycan-associated protein